MGGGGGAAAAKRYSLTLSASIRNLFNIANLAVPSGVVGTPSFTGGEAESNVRSAANPFGSFYSPNAVVGGIYGSNSSDRRIDLQMTFTF